MELEGNQASDWRAQLHSAAGRLPLGRLPQLSGGREDGRRPDEHRWRLRTAPYIAQRRRQQLRRPRLARRPALDELLLVARRENIDLSGQNQVAAWIGAWR